MAGGLPLDQPRASLAFCTSTALLLLHPPAAIWNIIVRHNQPLLNFLTEFFSADFIHLFRQSVNKHSLNTYLFWVRLFWALEIQQHTRQLQILAFMEFTFKWQEIDSEKIYQSYGMLLGGEWKSYGGKQLTGVENE